MALLLVFVCACGRSGCVECAGLKLPPSPVAPFDVVITENDRAVTVHKGERIELILHPKGGLAWNTLSLDPPHVLTIVPTGITAPIGEVVSGYEAVGVGTATITATATPLCSPGQACPQLAMLYEVAVTVSA